MSTRGIVMSGKVYDPIFLCMIGAVVLAVGTSVALRVVSAGAGPSAARASEIPPEDAAPVMPVEHRNLPPQQE